MSSSTDTEQFVKQLTEHQNRLFGYVFSLLGDHARSADVLQETNLTLWRKLDEFDDKRPFLPWAFGVARLQVLAHMRDQKRDKLLLDTQLAETMSREAEQGIEQFEAIRSALRPCIQLLTPANQELVKGRYIRDRSIADLATQLDRSVGSVKVALLRIRRQLSECVKRRLAEG